MVAEKPSIAKQVASLLAGHDAVTRRRGPSKYNLNFCFPITLDGREAPAVMTSVLGHVTTLDFPPEYSKGWNTVPMPALFTAPVIRKPSAVRLSASSMHPACCADALRSAQDMDKVVQNLVQEARGVTDLLIWTDCDQEGEHIGFEIINICLRVAPNARVRRAHFSAVSARYANTARSPICRS